MNPYDTSSISHYKDVLPHDNLKKIITSKLPCGNSPCRFGQREFLSNIDLADIETLYECGKEKTLEMQMLTITIL